MAVVHTAHKTLLLCRLGLLPNALIHYRHQVISLVYLLHQLGFGSSSSPSLVHPYSLPGRPDIAGSFLPLSSQEKFAPTHLSVSYGPSIRLRSSTIPSADFCIAVRAPCGFLSPVFETRYRCPRVNSTTFSAHLPNSQPYLFVDMDFANYYPVSVRQASS